MSSISIPALNNVTHAFPQVLKRKCWALSNGKKPWNYDRGFGLTWSDTDLLETFWQATDRFYDRATVGAGLGIFLAIENQIACLDLDGALDANGTPINEVVQHIVTGSCTFMETSVSGQGLHLFFEVPEETAPFHLRPGISGKDGDFFTQKRFIRLTGDVYGGRAHPIRTLAANQVRFLRENYGKVPATLPEIKPFKGRVSDKSLASRLSRAGIPYRDATITPQAFHNEHGGIIECIETECPNIKQHTTDSTPYARFVRCADGLITGRCFHAHCDPEVLRAAGKSLAGLLNEKVQAAGDPSIVITLLEKCEAMGMRPINGMEISRIGYPAVVEACQKFLRGVPC
jgi:hypothetical protein